MHTYYNMRTTSTTTKRLKRREWNERRTTNGYSTYTKRYEAIRYDAMSFTKCTPTFAIKPFHLLYCANVPSRVELHVPQSQLQWPTKKEGEKQKIFCSENFTVKLFFPFFSSFFSRMHFHCNFTFLFGIGMLLIKVFEDTENFHISRTNVFRFFFSLMRKIPSSIRAENFNCLKMSFISFNIRMSHTNKNAERSISLT